MQFSQKLEQIEARFEELNRQMVDPTVISDGESYRKIAKERSELEDTVAKYREYKQAKRNSDEAGSMVNDPDPELRQMATDEIARMEPELVRIEQELKVLLTPKDPLDDKNIVLEIRAGTGGDEATLFAAEVFRMYTRYAESQRWRVEVTSASESAVGGLKEVIALISGNKVYSHLKYESGVHRVQRVPATEQQAGSERRSHRYVLFLGTRRPVGQHHLLSRSPHAPADRVDRVLPGRKIADQESRQGRACVALAPL
jgi:peptide chain release factor 1